MTTVVSHVDAMSDELPDPEVPERAKRPRSDPARYKAEILAEYERLDKAGQGALRSGLPDELAVLAGGARAVFDAAAAGDTATLQVP